MARAFEGRVLPVDDPLVDASGALPGLDAIRGALDSLQLGGSGSSVDTYDRLGQLRRGRRMRNHQAA